MQKIFKIFGRNIDSRKSKDNWKKYRLYEKVKNLVKSKNHRKKLRYRIEFNFFEKVKYLGKNKDSRRKLRIKEKVKNLGKVKIRKQ